jgi:hexosaminidase
MLFTNPSASVEVQASDDSEIDKQTQTIDNQYFNDVDITKCTVIPFPKSVLMHDGSFGFNVDVSIANTCIEENFQAIITHFESEMSSKKGIYFISSHNPDSRISIQKNAELGKEAYSLSIKKNIIVIKVSARQGLFYAFKTLEQLIHNNEKTNVLEIPYCEITDEPRFAYRGMHLDVARHFFGIEEVKKYLDVMAMYKFNTFHWHLTDDQGWRFESLTYPKLNTISAFRSETLLGTHRDKPWKYDGTPYGGFYTQSQMRDVVAYAAARQITVIPEIELPGHSLAALAAYPELSCTGNPVQVGTHWGVYDDVYCTKEANFQFWESILTEVMAVFPSEYIHIGGDECVKTRWKQCAHCQSVIKKENLKNEEELQHYVILRIEKFLETKHKKLIGWDEILDGGLTPNATVMSWRGEVGGVKAAQLQHDVIMTPDKYCYFDHYQAEPKAQQPAAIGGMTTLQKVYGYEPIPLGLTTEQSRYIKGAQGNVWTEYIDSPEKLEYMAFPRAIALAEVVWSPKNARNWPSFQQRFKTHLPQLDAILNGKWFWDKKN